MTNQEALTGSVNYPLSSQIIEKALIDNSIAPSGEYTGLSEKFELATAALYITLCTSANIVEGGVSISMTDKGNMFKLVDAIYEKYGLSNPLKPSVRDRSNVW